MDPPPPLPPLLATPTPSQCFGPEKVPASPAPSSAASSVLSDKGREIEKEVERVLARVESESEKQRSALNGCAIVLTVTAGMMINTANSTAMSIALPTVAREWALEAAQLQWIVAAYPLSSGCLFLVFGRLADVHGRKKTFAAGALFLAVFTLACGFAPDVQTLDILRGIQGIGAAATIPASLGILAHAFPPSRARSLAFATFSAGAPLGAVFGTAIGGVLTEYTAHTWRSSFYLLAALTFLVFLGGLVSIDPDVPHRSTRDADHHCDADAGSPTKNTDIDTRIDWLGAGLVSAGLVCVVFVLSQGPLAPNGWATGYIIVLLILGLVLIGVFVYWQHHLEALHARAGPPAADPGPACLTRVTTRAPSPSPALAPGPPAKRSILQRLSHTLLTPPPLVRPRLWTRARGRLAAMLALAFANWCAFLAWTFWVQLYYQDYMGYDPMQSVVRLLPMFVSGIACNAFVGLMAARVPVVYLVATGAGATSLACLLFATMDPRATYWGSAFCASVLSVMGADFVFSAGTLFVARAAGDGEQSVAGALFNTMTQLGTAVGVTVTTVVADHVSAGIRPGEDNIWMYRAAQWTAFGFGVVATTLGVTFFRGVGVVGHQVKHCDAEEGLGAVVPAPAPAPSLAHVHPTASLVDAPASPSEDPAHLPVQAQVQGSTQDPTSSPLIPMHAAPPPPLPVPADVLNEAIHVAHLVGAEHGGDVVVVVVARNDAQQEVVQEEMNMERGVAV